MKSLNLDGKTALVTGAGRNIGRAISLALAEAGANVIVNVRSNLEEGNAVATAARGHGVRAIAIAADVSKPSEVETLVAQAHDAVGPIDILVNNAAVRPRHPFHEMTIEQWHWVLGVGLHGAFYCAHAVARGMTQRRWGRIVNISGRDGWTGIMNRAHGVTVKAGIHGLTKALALELGPQGITTNTIVPGLIETTRVKEWYPELDYAARAAQIPVRRAGRPEDIAELVVFLAAAGGYINGQALHVNGGEFLCS